MTIRSSLAYAFIDRYASLVISVVGSMVIARLLTPAEIGIFSVTMALLALLATVRDMGAGQYLVREKDITPDRIRAVWTVQLGIGVALALLVLAASQPLAAFYGEPVMRDILLILSLNYAINPFGSVTYAWLVREMRFDAIAIMRFCGTLTGAVTSITLAYLDHGAISLAWGSLAGTATNAVAAIFYRPQGYPWLPGFRELGRVLSFGSKLTSTSIMEGFASSAPEFFLGRLQTMAAAGFYSRSFGLVAMFDRLVNDAVGNVAVSAFSKEAREGGRSKGSFLKAVTYITALAWPFFFSLVLLADPVIRVLYGPQWGESVDLTRLLALGAALQSVAALCKASLIGSGSMSNLVKATVVGSAAAIVCAGVGAYLGLLPLGALILLSMGFYGGTLLWFASAEIGASWKDIYTALQPSACVALISSIGPALTVAIFGLRPEEYVWALIVGVASAFAGILLALRLVKHPLIHEINGIAPSIGRLLMVPRKP